MDAEISCECKQQNQQTNSNNEVLLAELQNIREGVEEVKTVKADIAELKTRIYLQENKENNSNESSRRIEYGCKDCKEKGINNRCNHCFICGKTDHKGCDCPEKASNKNRSVLGDKH